MTEDNSNEREDKVESTSETTPDTAGTNNIQALVEQISNLRFNAWYDEQQFEQNILEGQAYFNGPSPPKVRADG
ncbi:hypothetical protein E2L06_15345 [Haloterrigena sp. H1]|uniref:hypothetical protein n=1 Tax=Haloterrigena sp. H1 TaxID=2552943 RepID=UPI00110DB3F2|nr:hypothetical protein [Haloterrigena sp. H1]TMT81375.1 hypothetical protein E2L06_15345 [Haloterrigena sp. H1]